MNRREAISLVSRALSIVNLACALNETTYLPERLFSYLHYTNGGSAASMYFPTLYRISVGSLFLRIAIYLALAVVFWNCAPWVERILDPEREP